MNVRRRARERGQVTVFVVGLAVALMLVIGLTIDGGRALASRQRAVDEAQEAARTGAQALSGAALYGNAGTALDPQQAYAAAQRYIAATGDSADVAVSGDQVHVLVHTTVTTQILSIVGINNLAMTGTATATAQRGGTGP